MYCVFSLLRNEKAGIFMLLRPDYVDNRAAAQCCLTFITEGFAIFFTERAIESGQ